MKAFVAPTDTRCGVCTEKIWGGAEYVVLVDDEISHVDCGEDAGYEVEWDD